jgi:hypothetical protein
MQRLFVRSLATLVLIMGSAAAHAIFIVDTGASPFLGSGDPGISVNNLQFVAGRFTTLEDFEITSLATFARGYACCGTIDHSFRIGLASGPDVPNLDNLTTFLSLPVSFTSANNSAEWVSTAVDNYLLQAGTWWIVVSSQPGDFVFGVGLPGGVPDPLDAYAYRAEDDGLWRTLDPTSLGGTQIPATFGFRVEGNAVRGVPEPATVWLLAGGILAMRFGRRRRGVVVDSR